MIKTQLATQPHTQDKELFDLLFPIHAAIKVLCSALNEKYVVGIAGESIAAGQLVYGYSSGGQLFIKLASASAGANVANFIATTAATSGEAVEVISPINLYEGYNGLTPGSVYYLSTAPGAVLTTAPGGPAITQAVGIATSSTSLLFNVS